MLGDKELSPAEECYTWLSLKEIRVGRFCVEFFPAPLFVQPILEVTYKASKGWNFVKYHLWIGLDVTKIPQHAIGGPLHHQELKHHAYDSDRMENGSIGSASTTFVMVSTVIIACPSWPIPKWNAFIPTVS